MKIAEELSYVSAKKNTVVTVGVFDGVHLGHKHLFKELKREAERSSNQTAVVTFANHPNSVLRPDFRLRFITSIEDRVALIRGSGIDLVVQATFDLDLSRLSAGDFSSLLFRKLKMKQLVVGPDFAMGRNREGDPETLTNLGLEIGFTVHVADPLLDGEEKIIRSTTIRDALARGEVDIVNSLLGRNFVLTGTVLKGRGMGMNLGFPTANLNSVEDMAIPGNGIYATWAIFDGSRFMAATSVGTRPTFGKGDPVVEAFILNYQGNLYGRQIRLEFIHKLRDEIKYDTVQELKVQIKKDVEETKSVLVNKSVTH